MQTNRERRGREKVGNGPLCNFHIKHASEEFENTVGPFRKQKLIYKKS